MASGEAYLVPLADSVLRVFNPGSPQTRAVFDFSIIAGIIFAVIFAVVTGIIVYGFMRFRWREGEADPKQIAGNKTVELVWTGIPILIVIVLFTLTVRTMSVADPEPPAVPDLIVTGHQWWWEAMYPKSGTDPKSSVIVANEIHIPTGKALCVRLEATDVLHEFWVPELTRKMTTVPGHTNHIWLQADKPGTYMGVCSEFCGTQHAWMRFLVVAEEPAKFEEWQKAQMQAALPPQEGAAAKGMAIFQQMSCVNCHAINGTAAQMRIGPDLTHFGSRRQLGAGILENNPANLRLWLKNPQDVKPGVLMPDFKFTDEQVDDLVAYFQTLK